MCCLFLFSQFSLVLSILLTSSHRERWFPFLPTWSAITDSSIAHYVSAFRYFSTLILIGGMIRLCITYHSCMRWCTCCHCLYRFLLVVLFQEGFPGGIKCLHRSYSLQSVFWSLSVFSSRRPRFYILSRTFAHKLCSVYRRYLSSQFPILTRKLRSRQQFLNDFLTTSLHAAFIVLLALISGFVVNSAVFFVVISAAVAVVLLVAGVLLLCA